MEYIIYMTILIVLVAAAMASKLTKVSKKAIKAGLTPVSLPMAVHHENAKFRVRYCNLEPYQELYKAGMRNGQFGMILKHSSGMYAKTTVNGKCVFIAIHFCNYDPTGDNHVYLK